MTISCKVLLTSLEEDVVRRKESHFLEIGWYLSYFATTCSTKGDLSSASDSTFWLIQKNITQSMNFLIFVFIYSSRTVRPLYQDLHLQLNLKNNLFLFLTI